ncbi:MAG: hypothetical protein IJP58_02135 [Clostridia bacterium]|nr:hypothetical protein [Clostridia bacterium]
MFDDLLREIDAELAGVPVCNEKWNFYYDKTGNCRKLYLKDGNVNSLDALKYDFILGGIMTPSNELNITELKTLIKLQASAKELKFRHLYGNSYNFLDFISRDKTALFLEWLYNSDSYIHFSCVNNWYFAIVDLVDELYESHPMLFGNIGFLDQLKTAVYRFTKNHKNFFMLLLNKYEYPNIPENRTKDFCIELSDYIECNINGDDYYEGFYLETFRQAIKAAGKTNRISFGVFSSENSIIDSYSQFYVHRCNTFVMSKHIFDEEPYVQKRFEKTIKVQSTNVTYKFENSKSNEYIQLCDVVVGLLSHLFLFLDGLERPITITQKQRANLDLIWKIFLKSNSKNKLLIHHFASGQIASERWEKLIVLSGNR